MNFQKSRFFILFSLFSKFHETQKFMKYNFFAFFSYMTNFKISIHTFHIKFVFPRANPSIRFLNLGTFCWHWTVPHQIREEFSEKSFISSELESSTLSISEKQKQIPLQYFWKDSRFFHNLVANILFQCCSQQNKLKVNVNFSQMSNGLSFLSSFHWIFLPKGFSVSLTFFTKSTFLLMKAPLLHFSHHKANRMFH